MGTYLNPGKTAYEEAVNSEIFIDKTEMLSYLNSVVKTLTFLNSKDYELTNLGCILQTLDFKGLSL